MQAVEQRMEQLPRGLGRGDQKEHASLVLLQDDIEEVLEPHC
jgi:hypothetical protein